MGSWASPRICTHISQQEGIHLIVVSVKQKTQGLPGELGTGKGHRRCQNRPSVLEDPSSPSFSTAQESDSGLKGFPLFPYVPRRLKAGKSFLVGHLLPGECGKVLEGRDVAYPEVGIFSSKTLGPHPQHLQEPPALA